MLSLARKRRPRGARLAAGLSARQFLLGSILALVASVGSPNDALAQPSIEISQSLTFADSGRTRFDVDGVWNGTSEATPSAGDTVTLTVTNDGATTALDVSATVTLPSGFAYVAGTATADDGSGSTPTVTATYNPGPNTIVFTFAPQLDLDPLVNGTLTITYDLEADHTVGSGTALSQTVVDYLDDVTPTQAGPSQQALVTAEGAVVVDISPVNSDAMIGSSVTWTITTTNTGLGGLFDLTIDESNIGGDFADLDFTVTAAPRAVTQNGQEFTIDYLAPDETVVLEVEATLAGCQPLINPVEVTHRAAEADGGDSIVPEEVTASVTVDLEQPMVGASVGNVTLGYDSATTVTVTLTNSVGDAFPEGVATGIQLQTNIDSLGVDVNVLSTDWIYEGGGVFTRDEHGSAGDGVFSPSESPDTLQFELTPTNICTTSAGGLIEWLAAYEDGCGNPFAAPEFVSNASSPSDGPSITLDKTTTGTDDGRLEVGESGTFELDLTVSAEDKIAYESAEIPPGSGTFVDAIVVRDVLDATLDAIGSITPPGATAIDCGGDTTCSPGETLEWRIPETALPGSFSLSIPFTAPSSSCEGGMLLENTASLTANSTAGTTGSCVLDASSTAGVLLINNPDPSMFDQNFSFAAVSDGTAVETGTANADCSQTGTEGECALFTASYEMPSSGTWSGSTYEDDFGTAHVLSDGDQRLEPSDGSGIEISVDGSAFQAVGAGNVSARSGGGFVVDLAFVAALTGDANVDGESVDIRYNTSFADSALGGAASETFIQRSILTIAGGAGGSPEACPDGGDAVFTQGVYGAIERANAQISVSGIPSVVDICEPLTINIGVSNGTSEPASNLFIDTASSDFVVESDDAGTPPTYGGFFNPLPGGASITFEENGGTSPTWELSPAEEELTSTGTIDIEARLLPSAGASPSFQATINFDDAEESGSTLTREFSNSNADSPSVVRSADLVTFVTPDTITLVSDTAEWTIYVSNTGSGDAYNTEIRNQLPSGLVIDETATNALNTFTVTDEGGGLVTWDIGTLADTGSVAIKVVATLDGTTCAIGPSTPNTVTSRWGCGSENVDEAVALPKFEAPSAQLQILHDTSSTQCVLCGTGTDLIILRNTGTVPIDNVAITEILSPSLYGFDIDTSMAVEYSVDGGGFVSVSSPPFDSGNGESGTPYRWELDNQIPGFDWLEPAGSANSEVRLRFSLETTDDSLKGTTDPQITAGVDGDLLCGDSAASPGTPFTIPTVEPRITVAKTARNVTNGGGFEESINAGDGDEIEWEIVVSNGGSVDALNVVLNDDLLFGSSANNLSYDAFTDTISDDSPLPVSVDIPAGGSKTFTITETVSGCSGGNNTADVTWGCDAGIVGVRNDVDSPSDNDDIATINLTPAIDLASGALSQSLTTLGPGLIEIEVTLVASGGEMDNIVVTDTLPGGFIYDASVPATGTVNSIASVITVDASTPAVPELSFASGDVLLDGQSAVLTFRAVADMASLDDSTLFDPFTNPESPGSGTDPSIPAGTDNVVSVAFEDSCGGSLGPAEDTDSIAAHPDLDIDVSPGSLVVVDDEVANFDFTITNSGGLDSDADEFIFELEVGEGWDPSTSVTVTIIAAGSGASGGSACAIDRTTATSKIFQCTSAQMGSLASTGTATVRFSGTANNDTESLILLASVDGTVLDAGGDDEGAYSYDEAWPTVVGFEVAKTLVSTSEAFTSDSGTPLVALGEEITWDLTASLFGGGSYTSVQAVETMPDEFGYVTQTDNSSAPVVITGTTFAPAAPDIEPVTITYNIDDFSGSGTFDVQLTARVLSTASAGDTINELDFQFDVTFTDGSNSTDVTYQSTGLGGSESGLHAEHTSTIVVPNLVLTKSVDSSSGDAGDEFVYTLTIENQGDAPAFDLEVTDPLVAGLELVAFDSDTLDNDDDGTSDESQSEEGTYVAGSPGVPGSVSFDYDDTIAPLANDTSTNPNKLFQLDDGATLTLRYAANAALDVNTGDTLTNTATVDYTSLAGDHGNQSGPNGTSGQPDFELLASTNDSVDVTVSDPVFSGKTLVTRAVGFDSGNGTVDVLIGEQALFDLEVEVPAGVTPNFDIRDQLPAGLVYLSTIDVTLGAAVSVTGGFPTEPTPPINGASTLTWSFGDVTTSPTGDRTITVRYLTQVRNVAGNDGSTPTTLVNDAEYVVDGSASGDMGSVTLTVREADLAVTKTVESAASDAGDQVEYKISITNNGNAPAYDLGIVDMLPAGVEFTSSDDPPGDPDIDTSGARDTLTWGRDDTVSGEDIDLNPGATYEFNFIATLTDAVLSGDTLTNDVVVDWTSLNGDPGPNITAPLAGPDQIAVGTAGDADGERIADGGGTYETADDAEFTLGTVSFAKTASGATLPLGAPTTAFRIGDQPTYEIVVTFPEGTTEDVVVTDDLPDGLRLESFSIAPGDAVEQLDYNLTTQPSTPVEGPVTLTWDFGDVVNAADGNSTNDALTITYTVSVIDDGTAFPTPGASETSVDNDAAVDFTDGTGAAQETDSDTILVRQPIVGVAKSVSLVNGGAPSGTPASVVAGDRITYSLAVTNTGDAPAYGIVVTDTLPVGMRDQDPTALTITAAVSGGRGLALSSGSDFTTGYATGVLTITLDGTTGGNGYVAPGETITITYQVDVDDDTGAGLTLTNDAELSDYFGKETDDATDRRTYTGPSDDADVETPAPMDLLKTQRPTGGAAPGTTANLPTTIGASIRYRLVVPDDPQAVTLYDVDISDVMATPGLILQTGSVSVTNLGDLQAADAGVTATDTSTAGELAVLINRIPPNEQAIIEFDAIVEDDAAVTDGETLDNSASFDWNGSSGADAGPTVTSNTVTLEIDEPLLDADKDTTLVNGVAPGGGTPEVEVGDVLQFTVIVDNNGNAPAYDIGFVDTLPDELQGADPTGRTITATHSSAGALTQGVDFTVSYNGSTTLTFDFPEGAAAESIPAGGSITVTYEVVVADTTGGGISSITNLAQVDDYRSKVASDSTENRTYSGPNDDARVQTPAPTDLLKEQRLSGDAAPGTTSGISGNVGQTVTYRLTIPGTAVATTLYDVEIADVVSAPVMTVDQSSVSIVNLADVQTVDAGVTAVSNGTGNSVTVSVNRIPPNEQIVIEFDAIVNDVPANLDASTLSNSATFDWNMNDGADPGPRVTSNTVEFTVLEPALSIDKEATRVNGGIPSGTPPEVTVGDVVEYTVEIENAGTGDAHGISITDLLPEELRGADPATLSYALTMSDVGVLTETTDFTFAYDGAGTITIALVEGGGAEAIAAGETLTVVYEAQVAAVAAGGLPMIDNLATLAAYRSKAVSDTDENRTYSGSADTASVQTPTATPVVEKLQSLSAGTPTTANIDAAIGDRVFYRLVAPQNTLTVALVDVEIVDDLVAPGLVLDASSVTVTNLTALQAVDPTVVATDDSAGNRVEVSLTSIPAGTQAIIEFEALVEDDAAVTGGSTIDNAFTMEWSNGVSPPEVETSNTTTIDVVEPTLTVDKTVTDIDGGPGVGSPPLVEAGNVVGYQVVIENTGAAAAYALTVTDTLPDELTGADPTSLSFSATHSASGALSVGSDYAASWDGGGRVLTFVFSESGGASSLDPGETITLTYQAEVAATAASSLPMIDNVASVSVFRSQPTSSPDENRSYTPVSDEATVQTPASSVEMLKEQRPATSADPATQSEIALSVGERVVYTLTIPSGAQTTSLIDVTVTDTIPAGLALDLSSVRVENLSVLEGVDPGVSVTDTSTGNDVDVNLNRIPAGTRAVVAFEAVVIDDPGTLAGSRFTNQGSAEYGNGVDPPENVDSNEVEAVIVEPAIAFDKAIATVDGEAVTVSPPVVEVGDEIEYVLTAENTGDGPAFLVQIEDALPEELQGADPTDTIVVELAGGGALTRDSDFAATFAAGTLTVSLLESGSAASVPAGNTLTVRYTAVVASSAAGGLGMIDNVATLVDYGSQPTTNPDENRTYPGGDDTESVETSKPTEMLKEQTLVETGDAPTTSSLVAGVGKTIRYRLTVPGDAAPPSVVLQDVVIADDLASPALVLLTDSIVVANADELTTADPGVTINDASAGNEVRLEINRIPAGLRAIVEFDAYVEDDPAIADGTTIDNEASFAWSNGLDPSETIDSNPVEVAVVEPALGMTKAVSAVNGAPPSGAPPSVEAGDEVEYTIVVENTGTGAAYGVRLTDAFPAELAAADPTATVTATLSGIGALSAPADFETSYDGTGTLGVELLEGGLAEFIPAGESLTVVYTLTVTDDVRAALTLPNTATLDVYFSKPPSEPDENREFPGTDDDAEVTTPSPGGMLKRHEVESTSIAATTEPIDASVGETIAYTLTVPEAPPGVRLDDVRILDDIARPGLVLVVESVEVTNIAGLAAVDPTVAVTDNSSTDTVDLSLTSIPAGMSAEIRFEVRVEDAAEIVRGDVLTNTASYTWSNSIDPDTTVDSNPVESTVIEPLPVLALDGPANADLGVPAAYTARVHNLGNAPLYQPRVEIALPEGMRDADPLATSATLVRQTAGGTVSVALAPPTVVLTTGGAAAQLVSGTDYVASYSEGTLIFQFISEIAVLANVLSASEDDELTIEFEALLDNDAEDSVGLAALATVTRGYSIDSAGNPPVPAADVRTLDAAFGDGTTGTENGALGDDPTDDHAIGIAAPVISMTKTVDLVATDAGTTLHYTLAIRNDGSIDATDVRLIDDLDAHLLGSTVANLTVSPATGADPVVTPDGGVNGTGQLIIDDMTIPSGAPDNVIIVEFDVDLLPVIASGTVVSNQAAAEIPFFTDPVVSDSGNDGQDDENETGNAPGAADDDDPTTTVIESAPEFDVRKTDAPADGEAPVLPGDEILYRIEITNVGTENAIDARFSDAIPPNTSYVEGTTTLNGAPVSDDADGNPPFASGMTIQGPNEEAGSGDMPVGEIAVVTFRVRVAEDVETGTVIRNRATVDGAGEGDSGPIDPVPSDDPDTESEDDPTETPIGTTPIIDAEKTVTDDNGGLLVGDGGDTLTYTITVRNSGNAPANGVVLRDPIPANTSYEEGTLGLDGSPLTDDADGDAGEVTAGAVTVRLASLAPGESKVVTFTVRVGSPTSPIDDGEVIRNQGVVSSDELPDEPTDNDGNDGDGDEPTVIPVGAVPVLWATKAASDVNGGIVEVGDLIEYTIVLSNIGAADALGINLLDPIPIFSTYVSDSTTVAGRRVADVAPGVSMIEPPVGIDIPVLSPGESVTITFRTTIDLDTPPGTRIDNQGTYTEEGHGLEGVTDADLDDGVESGNGADNPNDDDPTRLQPGGAAGIAHVEGYVFLDADHDRAYDADDETPQAGWTVELYSGSSTTPRSTTTTNAAGFYRFRNLQPGPGYRIAFRHPETGQYWARPESAEGETTSGIIRELLLPSGVTVTNQNLPLDPPGVVYDAITRLPVAGVPVSIRYDGSGAFNPETHLLGGSGAEIVETDTDGRYAFYLTPDAPAGAYEFEIGVPAGYVPGTSTLIAPASDEFDVAACAAPALGPAGPTACLMQAQTTPPVEGAPVPYAMRLLADPSSNRTLVNNHLPIDPVLEGAVTLTKTTPLRNVSVGDLVPWTIRIANNLSAPLVDVAIRDLLPPGFKYVEGSGRLDGELYEPVLDGRVITWPSVPLDPEQTREITLILVVGAGVQPGRYTNVAVAINPIIDEPISEEAEASVIVVPDPTFDCSELIGKVFDDRNANGYQDDGEPGVAGVRLVTARGWLVDTDRHGRYHIACAAVPNPDRGSNFIIKLDPRSVPSGYRLTTENPRVIRLTRGKMSRANFGLSVLQVVRVEADRRAFEGDSAAYDKAWLDKLASALEARPSVLRIAYYAGENEDQQAASERLGELAEAARGYWSAENDRVTLRIETELVRGRAPAGSSHAAAVTGPRIDGCESDCGRGGKALGDSIAIVTPAPANTERDPSGGGERIGESGIAIIAEAGGEVAFDDLAGDPASERAVDLALAANDVQVRFDGGNVEPKLGVTAWPDAAVRGEPVIFDVYTNYAEWIRNAEVRIFAPGTSTQSAPLVVLPVSADGSADWQPGDETPGSVAYVVRVYDENGRFDETAERVLQVGDPGLARIARDADERERLIGYGESRRRLANIEIRGGAVTVNGTAAPGATVRVLGQVVPVDPEGRFVVQQILPAGRHPVVIEIADDDAAGATVLTREVEIPKRDWFYVGMVDVTVGHSKDPTAELVTGDDDSYDGAFAHGRIAFYAKGELDNGVRITASVDTREEAIDELFQNIDEKDPLLFLRELDADRYYPVYGDDSTLREDAPTQGRFYLKAEKGDDYLLWGNFQTDVVGTDLAQIDRAIYGAQARWTPDGRTELGEPEAEVQLFAAEPGTLQAREDFRGTGGSLYYLQHQNITIGSERIRIEVRDKDSGLVLATDSLTPNQDYDIDPIQGRILLTRPLPSTATDNLIVRTGGLSGNPVFLIVRYEYTPTFIELDEMAVGGRVSQWIGGKFRVGATASRQQETGGDQDLVGADVMFRVAPSTYVKAEIARTDGPGAGERLSLDGGNTFDDIGQVRDQNVDARAFRVEAAMNLSELGEGSLAGTASAYWQKRERGFSAPGQLTDRETDQWGLLAEVPVADFATLGVKFDDRSEDGGRSTTQGTVDWTHHLTDRWDLGLGLRLDDVDDQNAAVTSDGAGARTDAAVQLGYNSGANWNAYAFLQRTLSTSGSRDDNNRYGIGGSRLISDRLNVTGEASLGDGGPGGLAAIEFLLNDRTDIYLGYQLETDRSDNGIVGSRNGSLNLGMRRRHTDALSTFVESRFDHGDRQAGLTHVYGMDYAPADRWTLSLTAETGEIETGGGDSIERYATSVAAGYSSPDFGWSSALEYRTDETSTSDRETWLMRNNLSIRLDADWRTLMKFNFSVSEGSAGDFFDGDFMEGVLGFAYRPIKHDRLNYLLKYTYFANLPTQGQVSTTGQRLEFEQRSHILSVDGVYDLLDWLSLGGKYGLRIGELREGRGTGRWFSSTAQLGILRADFHIVHEWDLTIEGRVLDAEEAQDRRTGALVAIHRQLFRNMKLGVGYNFTDFSDDLTDLDYDNDGWFINAVGKF